MRKKRETLSLFSIFLYLSVIRFVFHVRHSVGTKSDVCEKKELMPHSFIGSKPMVDGLSGLIYRYIYIYISILGQLSFSASEIFSRKKRNPPPKKEKNENKNKRNKEEPSSSSLFGVAVGVPKTRDPPPLEKEQKNGSQKCLGSGEYICIYVYFCCEEFRTHKICILYIYVDIVYSIYCGEGAHHTNLVRMQKKLKR